VGDGQAGAVGDDLGDVGDRDRPRGAGVLRAPQPHAGRGGVEGVDGLVGQEAVAHVAGGELDRGPAGVLGQPHAVVVLVAALEAVEDRHGLLDRRLVDGDRGEAAFQRLVGLDVAAVLLERRRADDLQLAPRQRRLQDVRGVHRPLDARARPDDGVQLVEEEHDAAVGGGHLVDEPAQPLLELPAVLGTGDEPGEVDGHDATPRRPGHGAGGDARGDALDDRGLADARVADEHRVVLGAASQDLEDGGDLPLASDHRVEPPRAGLGREVAPEAVEHRGAGVPARPPGRRVVPAVASVGGTQITEALDELADQVLEGVGPLPGTVGPAAGVVAHRSIMRLRANQQAGSTDRTPGRVRTRSANSAHSALVSATVHWMHEQLTPSWTSTEKSGTR
jgi:hypothetical protein